MQTSRAFPRCALQIMLLVTGCASGAGVVPANPAVSSRPDGAPPTAVRASAASDMRADAAPPLPPVPSVTNGVISPRVQYPSENQTIASRDSNFILGSVGSGDAALTINGFPVTVAPNGAFIGWLPNPPAAKPQYELVATRGAETVRRVVHVKVPTRLQLPMEGKLAVDNASLQTGRGLRVRGSEFVRIALRVPANANAWVEIASTKNGVADTVRVPLRSSDFTLREAMSRASQSVGGDALTPPVDPTLVAEIAAERLAPIGGMPNRSVINSRVIVTRGADTIRLPITPPEVVDPLRRAVGLLRTTSAFESDTDRVVIGRPIPEGTYKWLLFPGTAVEITGKNGDFTRVRLDANLEVWVQNTDVVTLDSATPMPRRVSAGLRVNPSKEWVDLVIPLGYRAPFLVEPDGHKLIVTLYGVQLNPDISPMIGNDTLIKQVSWDQVTSDRVRMELRLSQPAYGWLALWDEARHAMVIRVRRVPTVNQTNPLSGMVIAVDPGHPPAGSTGPTGLFEGDAVLPVGELVAQLLRDKGAIPVLTRTTKAALGLTERTVISRRANANAFISIHLNAFGDGVNPFANNGTSTLFYHQTGEPLARPIQRELMKRMGLRDLGVHYQNLAVARPTWYPSALAEGAFIIMPEQESAMRDPGYQRRFAEGIVAGLESYFRDLASQ